MSKLDIKLKNDSFDKVFVNFFYRTHTHAYATTKSNFVDALKPKLYAYTQFGERVCVSKHVRCENVCFVDYKIAASTLCENELLSQIFRSLVSIFYFSLH